MARKARQSGQKGVKKRVKKVHKTLFETTFGHLLDHFWTTFDTFLDTFVRLGPSERGFERVPVTRDTRVTRAYRYRYKLTSWQP